MNLELIEVKGTSDDLIEEYHKEVDLKNEAYAYILEKRLYHDFKDWVDKR